ncbi:hypothetical protein NpPPO83_00012679 [Neofusicoccum parvum]|uniref:Uncharacterized protein n=1 Tax=Neofusicoccum parvum TaxID=310453 RepID=A0ACB5SNQ4_9PEZI|nr:hypothetical protein NpPPO83_00012679 [Neofusicoccum parvum]
MAASPGSISKPFDARKRSNSCAAPGMRSAAHVASWPGVDRSGPPQRHDACCRRAFADPPAATTAASPGFFLLSALAAALCGRAGFRGLARCVVAAAVAVVVARARVAVAVRQPHIGHGGGDVAAVAALPRARA